MDERRDQRHFFEYLQKIRNFFNQQGFIDCLTPIATENPGMETHLHPFSLYSLKNQREINKYLHTSPEFHMKELLSEGLDKIFTINYCFRDEPRSENHREQFLMLEWYRSQSFYTEIMDDCQRLIESILEKKIEIPRMSVDEIFEKYLNIKISDYLEKDQIRTLIKNNFKEITLGDDKDYSWDDYFFLIFLNHIEPKLNEYPFLILYEYPFHLSALSTINKNNVKVCDRFELYVSGVEIANAFNELEDINEQKSRFKIQSEEKERIYKYKLNEPNVLYSSLEKGINNPSGIALGVERLYREIYQKFPFWE